MTTWRPYRKEDADALLGRHREQCRKSGVEWAFPDLDDPRYLLVEVAERAGDVVGAVVAHATVELMFVGCDAMAARAAISGQSRLRRRLAEAGCDEGHAFVPRCWLPGMEPLLRRMGFRRSHGAYEAFYVEL